MNPPNPPTSCESCGAAAAKRTALLAARGTGLSVCDTCQTALTAAGWKPLTMTPIPTLTDAQRATIKERMADTARTDSHEHLMHELHMAAEDTLDTICADLKLDYDAVCADREVNPESGATIEEEAITAYKDAFWEPPNQDRDAAELLGRLSLLAAQLVRRVLDEVMCQTESFDEDNLGSDLAYLAHAIVSDGFVEWGDPLFPERHRTRQLFVRLFPATDPVWRYIRPVHPDNEVFTIEVSGGVAEVTHNPGNIKFRLIDHDNRED